MLQKALVDREYGLSLDKLSLAISLDNLEQDCLPLPLTIVLQPSAGGTVSLPMSGAPDRGGKPRTLFRGNTRGV